MRLLVCGAGFVTDELLNRLGEGWHISVVDEDEGTLQDLATRLDSLTKVVTGDPSSPVVLDKADLSDQDYVLALTDDDQTNLAVVRFAREKHIRQILSVVWDPAMAQEFEKFEVRTLLPASMLARNLFHYLQNPRVRVLSLSSGTGEIIELEVTPKLWVHNHRVESLNDHGWRVAAIVRNEELMFPTSDTIVQAGDKLVIIGRPDLLPDVCNRMECGLPNFPLMYGQGMFLCLTEPDEAVQKELLAEGLHLAQNIHVDQISLLCQEGGLKLGEQLDQWKQTLDVDLRTVPDSVMGQVEEICRKCRPGLVVVPPFSQSFWKSFTKSPLVGLAHTIGRPVLISRNTHPYRKILVPFVASPRAEQALEVAAELAGQLGAEVTMIFVQEPEFFHGKTASAEVDRVLHRAREIAHSRRQKIREIVLEGNPVKEIVSEAREYDLMVLGSETRERGFFSPHMSELLAQKSPCSVLIVAS